jgi:hypothetical protein
LLDVHELKDVPNAQELVGQARKDNLLKELGSIGHQKMYSNKQETKYSSTNDIPQGDVSPVGTKKTKNPDPRKGK